MSLRLKLETIASFDGVSGRYINKHIYTALHNKAMYVAVSYSYTEIDSLSLYILAAVLSKTYFA